MLSCDTYYINVKLMSNNNFNVCHNKHHMLYIVMDETKKCICHLCGLEWPSPHDFTSSIWDELKFIPIIGSFTSIEVGTFFSPPPPAFTSCLPITKIYSTTQAFQTPTPYLHPTKNPKLCYHSNLTIVLCRRPKTLL